MAEALLRGGQVDLMAIDSLAFMTSAKEIEADTQSELPGVQARMIGRGVRKFVAAVNAAGLQYGRRPTIILINQIRNKIGVMFGSPEVIPGGFAPGFLSSIEIKTVNGKIEVDEKTNTPLYVEHEFRIDKNKTANARMQGAFRVALTATEHKHKGDVIDEHYVLDQAQRVGLLTGSGSCYMIFDEKFAGKVAVEERMLTNPEFNNLVRTKLMGILLAI